MRWGGGEPGDSNVQGSKCFKRMEWLSVMNAAWGFAQVRTKVTIGFGNRKASENQCREEAE